MYCYLLESSLAVKYGKLLNQIELRLTDLGIKGTIHKIDQLSRIDKIISAQAGQEEFNLIPIGDHDFFSRVANQIPLTAKLTLGHIPVGGNPKLSSRLGIPHGLAACDTIAARRIRRFDVGSTNEGLFISCLEVRGNCEIECDGHYRTRGVFAYSCVKNYLSLLRDSGPDASPCDGVFSLIIEAESGNRWNKKKELSLFPLHNHCVITPSSHRAEFFLDGCARRCERLEISVIPQFLNVIVGKAAPAWLAAAPQPVSAS